MTMAYTYTKTFTLSHAKHLASKVVADLYQCSLLYDNPSLDSVRAYEEELITLLAGRYVETYEFGFKSNEKRVLTWHYTVGPAGDLQGDSRSGSLVRGIDISGAQYFNFLTYSGEWEKLTSTQQSAIKQSLPFQRTSGSAPGDGAGRWVTEHAYSAGGVLVSRRVFRPW
jgi:Bacterial HORMA domain family 1